MIDVVVNQIFVSRGGIAFAPIITFKSSLLMGSIPDKLSQSFNPFFVLLYTCECVLKVIARMNNVKVVIACLMFFDLSLVTTEYIPCNGVGDA